MSDAKVIVLEDVRPVWYAAALDCDCGHDWFAVVHQRALSGVHRCPRCHGLFGHVVLHDDSPRLRAEAQEIIDVAEAGGGL